MKSSSKKGREALWVPQVGSTLNTRLLAPTVQAADAT